jgi:hypothetical protein
MMSMLAVQAVTAVPESLLLVDTPASDAAGQGEDESGGGGLFLNIGSASHPAHAPTSALSGYHTAESIRFRSFLNSKKHACSLAAFSH